MPRTPSPLTPDKSTRHLFGNEIRERRELAGWSQEELGSKIQLSKSHVSRIEQAQSMPPPELPTQLDALFGTDVFTKLYGVAKNEVHPDQYRRRMELEANASRIDEYAGHVVPGLVQTQAYALALFKEHDRQATADAISGLWAARRSRQDLLKAPAPPHLSMILDEAVIRRPIGGPMVMREQLALLVGLADTPSTVMQVLPFRHGEHPLLGGSLTIFTFSGGTAAAYEESIGTGTLLESSEAVDKRRRDYDRLRAHALPPRMSQGLIKEAMEALSV